MTRAFYGLMVALASIMMLSCENEPGNPGDFDKACELTIEGPIVSLHTGKTYPLKVARETDTVYKYLYILPDTVFDNDGEPLIGADGKLVINDDSVYVYSKIKARFVEMAAVYLPAEADTFSLAINSNARWLAKAPVAQAGTAQWYFNHNSSTSGGGDGELMFRTVPSGTDARNEAMFQYVITSDSSVMYRIPFLRDGSLQKNP